MFDRSCLSARAGGASLSLPAAAAPAAPQPAPAAPHRYVEALFLLHHPGGLNRFVRSVSDPASPTLPPLRDRRAAGEALRRRASAPPRDDELAGGPRPAGTVGANRHLRARAGCRAASPAAAAARRGGQRLQPGAGARPQGPRGAARARHRGRRCSAPGRERSRSTATAAPAPAAPEPRQQGSLGSLTAPLRHRRGLRGRAERRVGTGLDLRLHAEPVPRRLRPRGAHRRGIRGQGLTVAVVEIDGFRRSDIATFGALLRSSRSRRSAATPVGIKRLLPPGAETTLDLEVLSAAAPRARPHLRLRGRLLGGGDHEDRRRGPRVQRAPPQRDLDLARRLRAAAQPRTWPPGARWATSSPSPPGRGSRPWWRRAMKGRAPAGSTPRPKRRRCRCSPSAPRQLPVRDRGRRHQRLP